MVKIVIQGGEIKEVPVVEKIFGYKVKHALKAAEVALTVGATIEVNEQPATTGTKLQDGDIVTVVPAVSNG